jgi:3-oxoacyl-[acyl-carrier protein] reductase
VSLGGQVALVTGGSGGIGRATCLALARAGAAVAVNYRSSKSAAEEVAASINGSGGRALTFQADVSDHQSAKELVQAVLRELGGLHVLVNNAGVARDALIYEMKPNDWLDVMRINFGGVFNCTQAAMEHFMGERAGSIVNVSSVMGERGWIGESNYAASKAAINAFTRCAAMELARFGVRVNAVLPGFVPTEMVSGILSRDGGKGVIKQIPMRAFGEPEAVADLVVFLAGPDSRYMTGSLVTVDGGASSILGVGAPLTDR